MAQFRSLQVASQPFDVAFHPSEPLICAGLISGSVELHTYGASEGDRDSDDDAEEETKEENDKRSESTQDSLMRRCWRKKAHKQACRAVAFMEDGQAILSAYSDASLVLRDTETGKRVWANQRAHTSAVNRLATLSEATVASGDDDGAIKVWDVRQPSCCASMSVHDDFVADMHYASTKDKLLAVSGDGTMSVFDLKNFRKEARSEYAEDELLSVTVVKGGRKVVCGSQEGVLLLYSWGHFNDCSDRFPGHPQSIDALIKLNEDAVITGCQDGLVRIVSILPNGFQGIVGHHMDCPIERLALSGDGNFLASASHNNIVKIWDLSTMALSRPQGGEEEEEDSSSEEDGGEEKGGALPNDEQQVKPASKGKRQKKEEAEEQEKAEAVGEDSDEEEPQQKERRRKLSKGKKQGAGNKVSAQRSNFFSDL